MSWFPARPYPQLLVDAEPGGDAHAGRAAHADLLQLGRTTCSAPRARGSCRPRPAAGGSSTPTRWPSCPAGSASGWATNVRVELPLAVHLAGRTGAALTRTLRWQVPQGSTLRLQQLLAQLGYLPLAWQPAGGRRRARSRAQLAAAVSPPPGRFSWRYPNTPGELRALWSAGRPNDITRGAVMMFEDTHGLDRRRVRRAAGLGGADRRRRRRQAPHHRLQLRLRPPQPAAVAQPLAQRPRDPELAGQHRRAVGPDAARHLPGVRAPRGRAR